MAYKYNPKRKTDSRRYRQDLKFEEFAPKRTDRLCRCGCGGELTGRLRCWLAGHEAKLVQAFQLAKGRSDAIRSAVQERDKGVCLLCGLDTDAEARKCLTRWDAPPDAKAAAELVRERYMLLGFPSPDTHYVRHIESGRRWTVYGGNWWEADHIVPVSLGGQHTLRNLRTVCLVCHRRLTANLAAMTKRRRHGVESTPVLAGLMANLPEPGKTHLAG